MSEHIRIEKPAAGVLGIVLDRAESKNAITLAMYRGMIDALRAGDADRDVRVLLVSGAGGNFTSGSDIADFQKAQLEFPTPAIQFLQALSRLRKPIVGAVEGHAVGIGTTMLLHCDMVYAAATARFRLPFVNLALCPEGASTYLLPKIAGYKKAAQLLMLGDEFDADTAVDAGIATAATPGGQALAAATECARALAAKAPRALQLTKSLLRRGDADAVASAILVEADHFSRCRTSDEAREAFAAFFEKRTPDFSRAG
ncbi:MAG TPA: enoyl-CoA hydratase [Burkholderiales bacterium]|jgi:enoyl-CoA hydratase/carnithine racemase